MPAIKKYIPKKKLVYIKGYGEIKYEESLNTIKYLVSLVDAFEVTDVLIDHSEVDSIPNMVDAFNLGSLMGNKFRELSFSVIYRSIFKESYNMFKNVGNKRGTSIRLFKCKADAIYWLIHSRDCELDKQSLIVDSF